MTDMPAEDAAAGPVVAVLPARGGSKRIPRKNIRPFLGVPAIQRTVLALQEADVFDRIVVSTDDGQVADVALAAGAEVPFRRSHDLSDDHTSTRAVVIDAIGRLEASGPTLGPVCSVYPTAVFLRGDDVRHALDELRSSGARFVVAATTFPAPIQRALRRGEDGLAQLFHPEHLYTRSQDLEPAFHDAAQFYWGHREAWLDGPPAFAGGARLYVLPRWRVQDLDTLEDWDRAERMMAAAISEDTDEEGPSCASPS